jgi:hypothetical protein
MVDAIIGKFRTFITRYVVEEGNENLYRKKRRDGRGICPPFND